MCGQDTPGLKAHPSFQHLASTPSLIVLQAFGELQYWFPHPKFEYLDLTRVGISAVTIHWLPKKKQTAMQLGVCAAGVRNEIVGEAFQFAWVMSWCIQGQTVWVVIGWNQLNPWAPAKNYIQSFQTHLGFRKSTGKTPRVVTIQCAGSHWSLHAIELSHLSTSQKMEQLWC